MHRKVIHVNFVFFSFAIFAGPLLVEIQTFCYHGNVTKRLLLYCLEMGDHAMGDHEKT